jgi:propionyl-CoA carboxylase alpha chain
VGEGGEISIHYDPMIAKLVTHAPDRAQAIDAQAAALDSFVIEGIRHNIPFLAALMRHPRWRRGALSTGFIAEEFKGSYTPPLPEGEAARRFAAVAIAIDHVMNVRKRHISGQMRTARPVRFSRERAVMLGPLRLDATLREESGGLQVAFADGPSCLCFADWQPGEPVWSGTIDAVAAVFQVKPILNGVALSHAGLMAPARVYTRREAELAALMPEKRTADTSKSLLCPMPGLVKAINVEVGQEVKAGEPLCMIEAMKMENVLRAERDVTVKKILAKEGDSLAVDAVIMDFA